MNANMTRSSSNKKFLFAFYSLFRLKSYLLTFANRNDQ